MTVPVALVRRPGPRLADGIVTHVDRSPVDLDRAREQWRGYVDALAHHGWQVVEVEPADGHPDAVFVEDPVVVHGDLAVIARSGAPARRGEAPGVERAVRDLGLRVTHIEAPGTLDGGDVLRAGTPPTWGSAAAPMASASSSSRNTCGSSEFACRPCPWSGLCT